MTTILPLTEARNRFAQLVDEASKMFVRFEITRKGRPEAVLMSKEEYDNLIETLEILSNPTTMTSLRRAEREMKAGKGKTLEEVAKELNL